MKVLLDGLSDLSIAKDQKSVENFRSWEDAIAHTENRISELRRSLRVFKENLERGEPWPGDEKAETVKESVPA